MSPRLVNLGNPIEGTITCRDQNDALFDPDVVQVSFVKDLPTGATEETLTYGGTSEYDSQLTRTSVGVYAFWFTADVAGSWSVMPRWQQTDDPLNPINVNTPEGYSVRVIPNTPHQFTDRPV